MERTYGETVSENDRPMSRMVSLFSSQQAAFGRILMPAAAERKKHLLALKSLLLKHGNAIATAIDADFTARSHEETWLAEIVPSIQSINFALKKLSGWMRPSKRRAGINFWPANARVVYQPLGVVGIIVPYNYPIYLAFSPLVGALAAGNRAMIKMSEFTPETAKVIRRMLSEAFVEDHVAVVTGDAEIGAAFSRLPFDHLLFSGSYPVSKLVMRAAADNLTPVTLELGGKSPAIIADDIPLQDVVEKLCFSKSLNAGQTCVAPDYVLVPRDKVGEFVSAFCVAFTRMFPQLNADPAYTSMINMRACERVRRYVSDATQKGGTVEVIGHDELKDGTFRLPMYLITNVTDSMLVMQEEIFGPILPVLSYDHIDEAICLVQKYPRALALYLFTYDRSLQARVLAETHSGSVCINDALLQFVIDDLPIGGVGASGMGQYHGHDGFLAMSKAKSVLRKGRLNTTRLLYPPYTGRLQNLLRKWLLR